MDIAVASLAFAVAFACAAIMGFAIQRGATCTVAAVEEALARCSFRRLASMGEASLWVAGGLLVAVAAGAAQMLPAGYAASWRTVAGGAMLGLGAFVNGACVFGAIARLGSGEWAYAATPLGFLAGCIALPFAVAMPDSTPLPFGSPLAAASSWMAALTIVAAALRLRAGWRSLAGDGEAAPWHRRLADALSRRIWAPHAATTVIGITFVAMLLLVGAWAYTDALADLARGTSRSLPARLVLMLALLAGAIAGGWTAGRLAWRPITPGGLARCFSGGALMGAGSLLIPGSNDGLILVGLPLLWPYAWLAFATMCATIAAAMLAARRLASATPWAHHGS